MIFPKRNVFAVREIRSIQGQLVRQGNINDHRTIRWQETRFYNFSDKQVYSSKVKVQHFRELLNKRASQVGAIQVFPSYL